MFWDTIGKIILIIGFIVCPVLIPWLIEKIEDQFNLH